MTLSRSNIASVIDYGSARVRITGLAGTARDLALRDKARVLLESFRDSDRF